MRAQKRGAPSKPPQAARKGSLDSHHVTHKPDDYDYTAEARKVSSVGSGREGSSLLLCMTSRRPSALLSVPCASLKSLTLLACLPAVSGGSGRAGRAQEDGIGPDEGGSGGG